MMYNMYSCTTSIVVQILFLYNISYVSELRSELSDDTDEPQENMKPEQETTPEIDTFPIRTLSEKTQVNTVTLRAWERRYGLLKPMRTGKGHRLYTEADVARVREILAWIQRGVSVGKVKELIGAEVSERASDMPASFSAVQNTGSDSHWGSLIASLAEAVERLNTGRIQNLLHDVLVQYPVQLCVNQWLVPVMERLQERRAGGVGLTTSGAARVVLQSELIRYALLRFEGHQPASGKSALLVFGNDSEGWRLAMLGLQLADVGHSVVFINQPCSVEAASSLVESYVADFSILLQDGRFTQADEEILKGGFDSGSLYLCGSAGVLATLTVPERIYKSTDDLLEALKNC